MFDLKVDTIELDRLRPFYDHPFNELDAESIKEMAESIKNVGIITPISVRPLADPEGFYEILSGHKRVQAAEVAGLTEIPARILNDLPDDIAMMIVCDTNFFQVSFPSFSHKEKAKAISAYYDIVKAQGKRNDLLKQVDDLLEIHEANKTSAQVLQKSKPKEKEDDTGDKTGSARDKAVKKFGLDRGTIANYLRVSKLSSELLTRLDQGEFKIAPAVEISYLTVDEQGLLNTVLIDKKYRLNTVVAEQLRAASKNKKLTSVKEIEKIFKRHISADSKKKAPITVKGTKLESYFKDRSQDEIADEIIKALELYRSQNKSEAHGDEN